MPSFLIRNLARIFALSQMEKTSQPLIPSITDKVAEGVSKWNKEMLWLIPFVRASGYRIVIENPKSHEKIVIDEKTKDFPRLSSSWLKRYDAQELNTWIANEEKREKAQRIKEERDRKKYGDAYKASNKQTKF